MAPWALPERQVHLRDLITAADAGTVDAWRMGDELYIDAEQLATLDLRRWQWTLIWAWARQNGTDYRAARKMIIRVDLESVNLGPRSRWVLEPLD